MPNIVLANNWLVARANDVRLSFASAWYARLFVNSVSPNPDTPLSAFLEATFGGYAPISLAGRFGPPVKIAAGQQQIATSALVWGNVSGPTQEVFGLYVTQGPNLVLSSALSAPVSVPAGSSYFTQLNFSVWDKASL